jgi:hypothetical protein
LIKRRYGINTGVERLYIFQPQKRQGTLMLIGAGLVLLALGGVGIWRATSANFSLILLAILLPSLLALTLVPLLAYRVYALNAAFYRLERDGMQLRWGLRVEEIPMDTVLWVRARQDYTGALPLPWLHFPGAIVGRRSLSDQWTVEYLAESSDRLVLIATPGRIYAISPAEPGAFIQTYHRFTELGSLTPLPARSVLPTALLNRVWDAPWARFFLIAGFIFSLLLLILVSLIIPTRNTVVIGFNPIGAAHQPVPVLRLLLLPLLNSAIYMIDLFAGLFFFRKDDGPPPALPTARSLAFLLWGAGFVTSFFFLFAVITMINR